MAAFYRFAHLPDYHEIRGPLLKRCTALDLLGTILTIRSFVLAGIVLVGMAALATAALVFLLSIRLRRREVQTVSKLGGSKAAVATVLFSEMVSVVALGALLAAVLAALTSQVGSAALRAALAALGA